MPKTSAATLDAAFSLAKMRAHFDPEKLVQYFDNTFKSLDHFANRAGDAVDAMMADIRIFKNEFEDEVDAGKDFIDLFWDSLKDYVTNSLGKLEKLEKCSKSLKPVVAASEDWSFTPGSEAEVFFSKTKADESKALVKEFNTNLEALKWEAPHWKDILAKVNSTRGCTTCTRSGTSSTAISSRRTYCSTSTGRCG